MHGTEAEHDPSSFTRQDVCPPSWQYLWHNSARTMFSSFEEVWDIQNAVECYLKITAAMNIPRHHTFDMTATLGRYDRWTKVERWKLILHCMSNSRSLQARWKDNNNSPPPHLTTMPPRKLFLAPSVCDKNAHVTARPCLIWCKMA